jgi:hypothetical protein
MMSEAADRTPYRDLAPNRLEQVGGGERAGGDTETPDDKEPVRRKCRDEA